MEIQPKWIIIDFANLLEMAGYWNYDNGANCTENKR